MSNRYLSNKSKAKKGISPVIATVILVAVAVVIAAALAGFSSSLFGSYSQSAQITVRSVSLTAPDEGSLDIVNKGGSAESVSRVSITNFGVASTPGTDIELNAVGSGLDPIIPANGEAVVAFSGMDDTTALIAGQTVTITVQTESGQTYTLSTIVN